MKLTRIAAAMALAGLPLLVATPVAAQSIRNAETPAELPPASFDGREYVDSRGCMYIRAGVDGDVTWVPRMTRDRQVVCGQTPTNQRPALAAAAAAQEAQESAAAAAAPAPVAPAAPQVVMRPAPRPAPSPTVDAGAPMRTVASVTMRPAPTPAPRPRATASRVMVAPAPQLQPQPRIEPQQRLQRVVNGVPQGQYIERSQLPPNARIIPRHVYENLKNSTRGVYVPKGFEPVWEDDRLNPKRAVQTLRGRDATTLVWTNTTPRRLIDRRSGRDVTAKHPKLYYPHTSMEAQRVARLSTKGAVAPKRQTAPKAAPVPARATPKTAGKTRFVQVGVFGQESNARAAATKLQRMGLPVRYGKMTRNGQALRAVLIPVASQSDMNAALNAARRAGFKDAFVR